VAEPGRLEPPLSDRRERSLVDILTHTAEEADALHLTAGIDEYFSERDSAINILARPRRASPSCVLTRATWHERKGAPFMGQSLGRA
jgi:hypothetical protein